LTLTQDSSVRTSVIAGKKGDQFAYQGKLLNCKIYVMIIVCGVVGSFDLVGLHGSEHVNDANIIAETCKRHGQ